MAVGGTEVAVSGRLVTVGVEAGVAVGVGVAPGGSGFDTPGEGGPFSQVALPSGTRA